MTTKRTSIGYILFSIIMLLLLLGGIVALTLFTGSGTPDIAFGKAAKATETYPLSSDAENYEFNIDYGKVTLKTAEDDPYIKVTHSFLQTCEIQESNGACYAEIAPVRSVGTSFIRDLVSNQKMPVIEIYLPKKQLNSVILNIQASEVLISNLDSKQFKFDLIAGDAKVIASRFESGETKVTAGNLEVSVLPDIASLKCEVIAGNMDLSLPKDIDGFTAKYNVNAGDINNDTSFDTLDYSTYVFWSQKGSMKYGKETCNIQAKVSMGNLDIDDYHIKEDILAYFQPEEIADNIE